MPTYFEGHMTASGHRFALVVSRFNEFITERLLEGALDALKRHGANMDDVVVARCPGSVEVPLVAKKLAETGRYDAIVCLGAVIRGATIHFDLVASAVATGSSQVAMQTGIPVVFGVLTTDTIEQAIERAGTKAGNNGAEAALTAIEMANLMRRIEEG